MPATDPRRLGAVLLAAACLAGAAAAHDGAGHHHGPQPVADTAAAAPWAEAMLRRPSRDGELLRARAAGAPLVIEGRVTAVTDHDGGKLRAGRIAVARVRRGPPDTADIHVVDIRGALRPAPWLAANEALFAVLEPAPDYSYLDAHLPAGRYHRAVAVFRGLDGEAADALAAWLALGDRPPGPASRAAALRLLAAGEPALARHALAELAAVPAPDALAAPEREAIGAVMRGPLPGKGELARQLGAWDRPAAAGLLRTVPADDAVTRARVWAALARLGAPPHAELAAAAGDDEPALRAAAAWGRGHVGDDAAIAALEPALGDADPDVRRVAIAALGIRRHARAPRLLAAALDSASQAQRVAAARALNRFDPRVNAAVLALAAMDAEHAGARAYAAKLLVARLGIDAEPVRELAARSDDPAVRRILAEGVVDRAGLHEHGHGPAFGK